MSTKNADQPINPTYFANKEIDFSGLTKREYTCIKLGIPESGCDEIDDLIRKAERKRLAGVAMQGILANSNGWGNAGELITKLSQISINYADSLLNELGK